ncbi:MAG: response regulator [Promethearchaeia archaeon]
MGKKEEFTESNSSNSKEDENTPKLRDVDEDTLKMLEKKDGNLTDEDKTEEMKRYEEETGKFAIWRGKITEGFRKWIRGEKIYDYNKERISLYVSEETKKNWQKFIESQGVTTISKLIRESVNNFIDQRTKISGATDGISKMDFELISDFSHSLKEPLTTIKGFSQLLLENYKNELDEEVMDTVNNIFKSSKELESKIRKILDDIKVENSEYDILLIEDDLSTIKLITSYFESKGYSCKGVISASKGLEELRNSKPKLILLDIILPDKSGYELCKLIKSDEDYADIPIFLLTAIPAAEVEKKMEEIGADGYILKPFDFSDFEVIFEYL